MPNQDLSLSNSVDGMSVVYDEIKTYSTKTSSNNLQKITAELILQIKSKDVV